LINKGEKGRDNYSELNDLMIVTPDRARELKERLADWENEVMAPRLGGLIENN